MSRFKRLVKSKSYQSFALKLISVCLTFLAMRYAAINLGVDEFGKFTFIISVVTLLSFPATLGLPTYIIRETQYLSKKSLIFNFQSISIIITFVFAIIICFCTFLIISFFDYFTNNIGVFLYISIILLSFNMIRESIQRANKDVIFAVVPEWCIRPIVLLLLFLYFKPQSYLITNELWVFAILASSLIGIKYILSNISFSKIRIKYLINKSFSMVKKGIPFLAISGITLINNHIDILMLTNMKSTSEAGVFRVNFMLAQFILLASISMTSVKTPIFATYISKKLFKELSIETRKVARLSSFTVFPCFLILFLYPSEIVNFIYGEDYIDIMTLRLLAFTFMFDALCGPKAGILNMAGYEKYLIKVSLISLILNLILNYFFIYNYGSVGAALATFITTIFISSLLVIYTRNKTGVIVHV